MLSELQAGKKTVGRKQSQRAIREGRARRVYVALDAELPIRQEIARLCQEAGVPVTQVDTMGALGRACGIQVGAAVAALLEP